MKIKLWLASLSMLLLASCAHKTPPAALLFPESEGARQAYRDITDGRIQLMEAGTRGVSVPNVPTGDYRFSKLPRHRLPSGCTTPKAAAWRRYAEAYNSVVVAHVSKLGMQ